jgi:hypothetical protein
VRTRESWWIRRFERSGRATARYGPTTRSSAPTIDPLTVLAAVAAATERVTLGTAALLPAFRRPVQADKAIARARPLVEAGARHIVLRIAAPGLDGQRDQLDRLADLLLGVRDQVTSRSDSGASGSVRP